MNSATYHNCFLKPEHYSCVKCHIYIVRENLYPFHPTFRSFKLLDMNQVPLPTLKMGFPCAAACLSLQISAPFRGKGNR